MPSPSVEEQEEEVEAAACGYRGGVADSQMHSLGMTGEENP